MTQGVHIPSLDFWASYLAHNSQVVVAKLDGRGEILEANAAFSRLLAIEHQRVIGERLSAFLVSDSETLWNHIWPPEQQTTLRLHFAYGEQMPQTLTCCLLPLPHGGVQPTDGARTTTERRARASEDEPASVVVSGGWLIGEADVRELLDVQMAFVRLTNELTTLSHERASQAYALEQARRTLERRNEELDAFAQIVSHDLKAPLRTFRVFTAILRERYHPLLDEQGRNYLELLGTAADRIHAQIDYLLQLAQAGQLLDPQPAIALDALLTDLRNDLGGFLAERGAALLTEPGLPCIWGDYQRLRGVFQNVIVNGLTYNTSAEPCVRVSMHAMQAATVTLAIADNGVGIAAEDQERIWLPFERLRTADRQPEGQGLGLAFCRRVVEAHGGSIRIESQPGAGTTFLLTLPRIAPTLSKTYGSIDRTDTDRRR